MTTRPFPWRPAACGALVLCLLLGAGCASGQVASSVADGPNVLVVVLDACRADKLGLYGNPRPTSPALDALAADPDAVVFEQHYVQGTWTKPSTASLFTGKFVYQHGVLRGHDREAGRGVVVYETQALGDDQLTLAERLQQEGFHTFGVVKSWHLVQEYGFAQGFDVYLDPRGTSGDRDRVQKTLDLIAASDGRFFGYLHLNACHYPFRDKERDPDFLARYAPAYDEEARRREGIDFRDEGLKHAIRDGKTRLEPADTEFLEILYEAQLHKVDRELVTPLLEGLRKVGAWDGTLLFVTADHGEELYEHEGYAHGHALWQEVVHVPLIVKFPKGRRPAELPGRIGRPTQAVDLYPTIVGFIGAKPPGGLPGGDLFQEQSARYAFAEREDEWMLLADGQKLIDSKAGPLLFDLPSDPDEQRDVAASRPEAVQALRESARALHGAFPAGSAPTVETELEPEAIEALKSLGYLR